MERIARIFLQTIFWGGVIVIILTMFGSSFSLKNHIAWLFPITMRSEWFVSFYIVLLFISPYLNQFFKLKEFGQGFLLVILTYITVIMPTLMIGKEAAYYSTLLYMIYIYLLTGWIKHHLHFLPFTQSFYKMSVLAIICYLGLYAFSVLCEYCLIIFPKYLFLNSLVFYYSDHFETVPSIICAYSWFFAFYNWHIKSNKFINYFSSLTLGVYIIHQVPVFYSYLWIDIFSLPSFAMLDCWPLYLLAVILTIYIVASLMDIIWISFVAKIVFKILNIKQICQCMDEKINKAFLL